MTNVSKAVEETEKKGGHLASQEEAKWAAFVDDTVIPMPRRLVRVDLVKELASVPEEFVLVRDANSPDDEVLEDGKEIDLAKGNVLYSLKRCEVKERDVCKERAKLAWILNDVPEITVRPTLTGKFLRELFNLAGNSSVLRDTVTSMDVEIEPDDNVRFEDGPVFISRHVQGLLTITVNLQQFTEKDGVKPRMSGLAIAALAYPETSGQTRVIFLTDGNREIPLTDEIDIKNCDAFEVVRCGVTGGLELARVERELAEFPARGHEVTLVRTPTDCVVYHKLPTKNLGGITSSDVLVPVPAGYPGQFIDLAYLPVGSPLIGKVKGQPEGGRITALGLEWQQISYHPHNGGGGPSWNPAIHGFHTYRGELVAWLFDLQ